MLLSYMYKLLWTIGSVNLLRSNRLVQSFSCLIKAVSLSWKWVKKRKKVRIKQSSTTMKTWQRVPKHRTTVGMLNTDYPFPWNHEVLLLDNTKTFQLMYYIFYKQCLLFICKYLFIYLVCGSECIFMHTYYTICFWALCEGCIVTQT